MVDQTASAFLFFIHTGSWRSLWNMVQRNRYHQAVLISVASIARDSSSDLPPTGAECSTETRNLREIKYADIVSGEQAIPMPPCPGLRTAPGKTKHDYHQDMRSMQWRLRPTHATYGNTIIRRRVTKSHPSSNSPIRP
jgi:hypothetical protein